MPLDPMILMLLGIGLIVVVTVYQQPRLPLGSFKLISPSGDSGPGAGQGDPARTAPDAQPERTGLRDLIGWLGILLGLAVTAYGLYLQYVAG